MAEFLCTRKLRVEGVEQEVVVCLGKPEQRSEREFVCPFQVTGIGNSELQYAHGVDSFQALILALEGIRVTLEKGGQSCTWIGEEGDHGFPRYVPSFFGLEFSNRLGQIIESEIASFAGRSIQGGVP